MKKALALVLALVMMACVCMACAKKTNDEPKDAEGGYKIAYTSNYLGNSWRTQYEEAIRTRFDQYKEKGVVSDYTFVACNSDVTEQLNQLNALLQEDYDLIMIDAVSASSLTSVIEEANEKGVKILLGNTISIPVVLLIGIAMAIAMGAINGVLVSVMRINPMMTTFATQSMYAGLALWIMKIPGGSAPIKLTKWFATRVLGYIPMSLIVVLALLALVLIIMRTPIGVKMYAIGNNEEKAYISGIRVVPIKFFAYVFSGFAAGVAAICYTARTGGGDPTAALTLTLNCIAACVIGGLSLAGGKGTCVGGLWGALFLQMIISTILSARIPTMAQDLVEGLIIFVGIAGTIVAFSNSLRKRRHSSLPPKREESEATEL